MDSDLASTDSLAGYIGDAESCTVFQFWTPHEAHHLAYTTVIPDAVAINIRIFDIYAAAMVVSNEPRRYFQGLTDTSKQRFLAIDSISRKTINTPFDDESRRIDALMRAFQRVPPFFDPL